MNLTLESMPDHARLWIYQSNRPFSSDEERRISELTHVFIDQWAAHGQKLKAAFSIQYHQFIVLSVDESFNLASGCSIDASVNLIQKIEAQFGLSLLDRTKIAFWIEESVALKPLSGLKAAIQAGEIEAQTTVFNNVVQNAGEWKKNWMLPASKSWLSRYFQ